MNADGFRQDPLWSAMLPNDRQGRNDLCAVKAHGVRVHYADGRSLLCGTSGLWNANLGYGNLVIAEAVADAMREASYLGTYQAENLYARRAAAALVELAGDSHFSRVIFSTSGGAANDLVIKLVRQYHVLRGDKQRKALVGMHGCWHGLTYGAFALTSDKLGQAMYGVDRRLVVHVAPNDVDELAALFGRHGDKIGAVVVEPVLGTGAVPIERGYLAALLQLREEHGFLVVADEVATGFGRTGYWFASENWPQPPDVVITAKGLTNGTCAASAVIVSRHVANAFARQNAVLAHGETQAGTPVSCAAILATISEMRRLDALGRAASLSAQLDEKISELVESEPRVAGTTGLGCIRSLRLVRTDGLPLPAGEVAGVLDSIRETGAIVHAAPDGIQILPALIYTEKELEELFACIRAGLEHHFQKSEREVLA